MSLFNTSLVLPGFGSFAGLANYRELFGDSRFWQAMWHTILFTLVSTPPLVLLSLFFAIAVNRISRGQWFFRLAFFLPYILPSAVIALIWTWLYEPGYGLIDGFFHLLGLGPPGWLSSPSLALYPSSSSPCGGRSDSISFFTSRACRRSPARCMRPRRSTAPAGGGRPGG